MCYYNYLLREGDYMTLNHRILAIIIIRDVKDETHHLTEAAEKDFTPSASGSFKGYPYYLTKDLEGDLSWKTTSEITIKGLSDDEDEDKEGSE
jgi:hypothetical protein